MRITVLLISYLAFNNYVIAQDENINPENWKSHIPKLNEYLIKSLHTLMPGCYDDLIMLNMIWTGFTAMWAEIMVQRHFSDATNLNAPLV